MARRRCWRLKEVPSFVMAARMLELNFGMTTGFSLISALRRIQGLETDNGGSGALSYPVGKLFCRRIQAPSGQKGMPPERLQESLWHHLFANPTKWWDHRRSKLTIGSPDFMHKISKVPLWLNNRHKPAWVDPQLVAWDAGIRTPPMSLSSSIELLDDIERLPADEGPSSIGVCRKLCEDGKISDAVDALHILVQQGCHVGNNLFYCVLKSCIAQKDLVMGRRIHALATESGYEGDAFLATHFIGLYASHGMLEEAMQIFRKVRTPSTYNWATIIFAYARHGEARQAIRLYREMLESTTIKPNNRLYVAVLKACATARDLVAGKEVHAHILASPEKPDSYVQAGLVSMYAKCSNLGDARRVFDTLPEKDVVAWTAMLSGYAQQGMGQEALTLYSSMQKEGVTFPNTVTFVSLLQACASVGVGALEQGRQLHARIQEQGLQDDIVLGGSLVNMYAKCSSLEDARRVFDKLPVRNVVAWTAMLAGYAQEGGQKALNFHDRMEQEGITTPDSHTFVCLLQACASVGVGALQKGVQLHAQIEAQGVQQDVVLGASLVNMYAKCGSLKDARWVFDRLPERDVVAWTAMLAGFAREGMGQEALNLYRTMKQEGINTPNSVTFVCLLQACAIVAALPLGKQLHGEIKEHGLQADLAVGGGLVNMYAKCGSMFDAQQVFDSLPEKSIEAWNALTSGYARQGDSEIVFDLVKMMVLEGIKPDGITFLSVLTVCSHAGKVDKGQKYFEVMKLDYGISPMIEHYTCMVDLLGRAGHLDEALQITNNMPSPPDSVVWLTLLAACQKWRNVEIGELAFECAVSLDGEDPSSYVLMSNIYASTEMFEEAEEMQARRKKLGAWKKPGQSWWTDMGGVVHTFVVGDKKHPESEGIYARLDRLVPEMKKAGYVPHLHSSLRDISDGDKEVELCGHSEKLAIAYALNKTPEGTSIRIVKNLRVCEDCHSATGYISKVEKRTIICRDASRFHFFKDGKCSCGDYW